jgi:hypothetical protein
MWKGGATSWEPVANLNTNCLSMVEAFEVNRASDVNEEKANMALVARAAMSTGQIRCGYVREALGIDRGMQISPELAANSSFIAAVVAGTDIQIDDVESLKELARSVGIDSDAVYDADDVPDVVGLLLQLSVNPRGE